MMSKRSLTLRTVREFAFVLALGVAALPIDVEGSSPVVRPDARTGVSGRLIASYAPDGNPARALLTVADLDTLAFESLDQVVNDIQGRGDDVFVALGAPAVIATYRDGNLTTLPGLGLEFLSAPALTPNRDVLAFARDPRRANAGEEIWLWDLQRKTGRAILRLPAGRYAYSMAWRDDDTLIAEVAGHDGETPQLLVLRDGKITHRYRANGLSFMLATEDRIIQTVRSRPGHYPRRERAYVRNLAGGNVERLPQGWTPECVSPDGLQILLARREFDKRIALRTELALAPMSDPTQVRAFATVRGGLYGCVWQSVRGGA